MNSVYSCTIVCVCVCVCVVVSHFLNEPIRSNLFMTAPSTAPKKRFVCGKHYGQLVSIA